ncbi:MAG: AzlD domain-containing protein [Clostridiales bacterium]|nr:AzlD domain-containing protein [Candidatus Equinaster intestinalis]
MTSVKFLLYLLTMAGVTYLVRMVPLVLVKKPIKNEFVLSFLHYIPYAVLAVMTVPAVFFATSSVISAAVGVGVALLLAFLEKSLLTVSFCACIGVFVTELIMKLF